MLKKSIGCFHTSTSTLWASIHRLDKGRSDANQAALLHIQMSLLRRSVMNTGIRLVLVCLCRLGILSVARPLTDLPSGRDTTTTIGKQPATTIVLGVLYLALLAAILIVTGAGRKAFHEPVYCLCTDCIGNGICYISTIKGQDIKI